MKAIDDVQAGDLVEWLGKLLTEQGCISRRVREIHYYPVGGRGEGLLFGR